MHIEREASWGHVTFDREADEFWAWAKPGSFASRLELPLAALLWLGTPPRRRGVVPEKHSFGAADWIPLLDSLRRAGILRLALVGFEALWPRDLRVLLGAIRDREMAPVLSATRLHPGMEDYLDDPEGISLQVLFDPARSCRVEAAGGLTVARRLRTLRRFVAAGFRTAVLSPYDPRSPLTLAEVGAEVARAGARDWKIYPGNGLRASRREVPAEVKAARRELPGLEVQYGDFLARELALRVRLDGTVRVKGGGWRGSSLAGEVAQLGEPGFLSTAFLDRQAEGWLEGALVSDRREREKRDPAARGPVFLSYSRPDSAAAAHIRSQLAAAGVPTWSDLDLRSGENWMRTLTRRMEESSSIVVLLGANGPTGFQGRLEVPLARQLERKLGKPLIPAILPGVEGEPKIPDDLAAFPLVDLRQGRWSLAQLAETLLRSHQAPPPRAAAQMAAAGDPPLRSAAAGR